VSPGGANRRRKRIRVKAPWDKRACQAGVGGGSPVRGMNGPAWRPGPTGPKSKERLKSYLIFEFRWIFWNLTRLGENLQVDLGGIWT
jgi:hypothetical protein